LPIANCGFDWGLNLELRTNRQSTIENQQSIWQLPVENKAMRSFTVRLFIARAHWLGLILFALAVSARTQEAPASVVLVEVDGIIHPVTAEFMTGALDHADAIGARLVVFTLRTPGGLVDSTRDIISKMIAARTPSVIYVAPSGSRAASAGFLLTIAADVAAMAPSTTIGAAHPVAGDGAQQNETVAKKAAEDVASYARSLATARGRNVQLAAAAVLESRSFTDEEALTADPPLISLRATDIDDLLRQLDGRTIKRFDQQEVTLHTNGAPREVLTMTWRHKILSAIAHPQVAYLLFSLGTLGLTIELWSPGAILPGVVGGLCLLLAFFVLPVNLAGLLLLLFGFALLILEVKVTSFGVLAIGGIISLIFGSLMLIDAPIPEMRLGLSFVLPVTLAIAGIVLALVRLAVQAQRQQSVVGAAGMIGIHGIVVSEVPAHGIGTVSTRGELWSATSDASIEKGEPVEVVGIEGLKLTVRRPAPSK
jgi:membrane-bound serine protease (ClpP class)